MQIWDAFPCDQYLSLVPWARLELETGDSPPPFPSLAGVAPEVVASLQEAHRLLSSALTVTISDLVAGRATLGDPRLRVLVEDAYAELVQSRSHLRAHIQCGREPDGTFRWEFPKDPAQTAIVTFVGVRIVNALTKREMVFGFERPITPAIGKLLGFLDGTHTAAEVRAVAAAAGGDTERELMRLLEVLNAHKCLVASARSAVRARWLMTTQDRDVVHLGHAGLLYRQQDQFLCFDPWLVPWFAEAPVPSLWGALLPRPAALFLTHEHNDHMDERTLLQMPKDIPVIVPSRHDRRELCVDYPSHLRERGFQQVIELAHGERWTFEGGAVVSVPFFGEDPCDLELPRNCYLIVDRGRNTLLLADSCPTNTGRSVLKDGVIEDLVQRYGPIATVFASRQQTLVVRATQYQACLSHPGRWLEMGEYSYLPQSYLVELAASAKARLFVSYATGGADWFSDHFWFMFKPSKPARTLLETANWESLENLREQLAPYGCGYHDSHALDIFRRTPDGGTEVVKGQEELDPRRLLGADSDG
jgi:L-ascorbate metabolism protein UlaG (beta-lactamase superfamily)